MQTHTVAKPLFPVFGGGTPPTIGRRDVARKKAFVRHAETLDDRVPTIRETPPSRLTQEQLREELG